MVKHILIVNNNQGKETSRSPQSDEVTEILNVVLTQLIRSNQEKQNLIEFLEERLIHIALEQTSNNKTHAAEILGIHRKQLERRSRKYQPCGT